MKFPGRALGLLAVAMTAAAGTGAIVAYLLMQPPTPASLEAPSRASVVPVVEQEFTDPASVEVIVRIGPTTDIRVARSGLVTASSCAPGAVARSGEAIASLDGMPLLALHTVAPLWRELRPGDRGADVDAVKAELTRLGVPMSAGPRLGQVDLKSFDALREKIGAQDAVGMLSPGDVVWLPAPEISVASCDARLNALVEAGGLLGTAEGSATIAIGDPPAQLLPGARMLTVDAVTVTLDEALGVTDAAASLQILDTAAFREASIEREPDDAVILKASMRLVEPVAASALPPTAITVTDAVSGCVTSAGGEVRPVRILASQLGSTVVAFEGDAPASVRVGVTSKCS